MNATLISKEKTEVKFSFEVSPEVLETGLAFAYNKNKNQIALPGFRKGKVPRKLIEAQYGENFFYEDAINHIFPDEYMAAIKELGLDVVSAPTLDVEYIDKAKGVKFLIDVTVKPEVTLGQYKGLSVEKVDAEVKDEDVMAELERVQKQNARNVEVTDRPAQMGDVVKIDYEGSVDGVPFDGGKAEDYSLELGSHSFIEGFEDQVAGHSIGENFDINVTFPEAYHAPELAGKPAVFAISLKGITAKELPELNDAFAEDVSEFSTLDEYKADILAKLAKEKTERAKQLQGDKLLDAAVANCTMEVPQVMYDNKINSMMKEFEQNIMQQGLSMDIYYQYMGTTEEAMRENFKDTSMKSVDARLMLEQIAKEENLTISQEDLDAEVVKYGESYGIDGKTMLEMMREEDKEALKQDMLVRAAMKLIEDTAVLTEPEK
ncbi:trigger factor [Anaerotignum lactatifermentans]|uniref:Trigger factor n=1 Tax=Anaerotignum lactatifermentans TaxID=160404 RepID=A0ABS2GCE6_9FIRM|nr:trigger factor [Anaerotignum lactatifermentans]MBM6830140.1 trigger factor [Anaerotignum lactatifermentans]MBM6878715.1 trigger factor [Anaerotignum lactatifermentans]MBM6951753.1 trigger factor [Anaerotignum lactatifermentans]